MNRLNKASAGIFVATLIAGICVSGARAADSQASVRASADRVAKTVAGENPIRQDAKRLYPEVVAEVNGEKITLQCVCGKDAVAKGVRAGDVIKTIAPIVGGRGGGKPDSAMGGGSDISRLDEALAALESFVADKF